MNWMKESALFSILGYIPKYWLLPMIELTHIDFSSWSNRIYPQIFLVRNSLAAKNLLNTLLLQSKKTRKALMIESDVCKNGLMWVNIFRHSLISIWENQLFGRSNEFEYEDILNYEMNLLLPWASENCKLLALRMSSRVANWNNEYAKHNKFTIWLTMKYLYLLRHILLRLEIARNFELPFF